LGGAGLREVVLATAFGAASSSCSYAAVAAARSAFQKGASLVATLAFMFASTNLVFELGFVLWLLMGWRFVLACAAGGLAQVIGTSLLIMAFGFRNFTVGTAYAKTDAVQAALLGAVLLHETLSWGAWAGIGLGLAGVQTLSLAGQNRATMLRASLQPAALCGIGAGAGFALAGVAIKYAVGTTNSSDVVLAALCALVVTNTLQTLMQGSWMAWREPAGLRAAFTGWRSAMWVGVLSGLGSAGWFTAFSLAPVALVRTAGQADMVFTLLFSRFYLREQLRRSDVLGLVLMVGGVITVLLFH